MAIFAMGGTAYKGLKFLGILTPKFYPRRRMKYLALGERIKAFRVKRKMKIEEVSKKSGIPKEQLERIEANEEQPIIAALIQIAKALEVNVADIFRERPPKRSHEIIKKTNRELVRPLRKANPEARIFDYTYELLTIPGDDKHLEAFLIELPPHQSKKPTKDVTHAGEEFMYVLDGELHGEIDGESIHLLAGDSLFLRSTSAHVFFNPTEKPAKILAVIYPY